MKTSNKTNGTLSYNKESWVWDARADGASIASLLKTYNNALDKANVVQAMNHANLILERTKKMVEELAELANG